MKRNQSGFTLVEIAIVLVIIGLLLGAVLKGQELVTNAKVKAVINEAKAYGAALYAYQDRYGYYPGDDPKQQDRWTGLNSNGDGDGTIDGGTCDGAGDESCQAIRAMRYAGLIKGDPAEETPKPGAKAGGQIHLYTNTLHNQTGVALHMNGADFNLMNYVDLQADDGQCDEGSYVGGTNSCTGNEYTANDAAVFM